MTTLTSEVYNKILHNRRRYRPVVCTTCNKERSHCDRNHIDSKEGRTTKKRTQLTAGEGVHELDEDSGEVKIHIYNEHPFTEDGVRHLQAQLDSVGSKSPGK